MQNEHTEFILSAKKLIESNDVNYLYKLLEDQANHENIIESGWELVPFICLFLDKENAKKKINPILECLCLISKICNPKEVHLGLLQPISSIQYIETFHKLTKVIAMNLLGIKQKQSIYYAEVAQHFLEFSSRITLSQNEDSMLLHDSVNNFLFIICKNLARKMLNNLQEFRYEESFASDIGFKELEFLRCRKLILQFIFDFLGIINEYFTSNELILSTVDEILKLESFAELVYSMSSARSVYNPAGVVVFFHGILLLNENRFSIPMVFRTSSVCLEKNMCLLKYMLQLVEKEELDSDSLLALHQKVLVGLTKIMVWCQQQNLREQARDLFLQYYRQFNALTGYQMLRYVYKHSEHAGLLGFLITHINICLQKLHQTSERYLINAYIGDLSLEFIKFIPGETNILYDSDRLMSGLNFIRYWLLKDCQTGEKQEVKPDARFTLVSSLASNLWKISDMLRKQFHLIRNALDLSHQEFSAINGVQTGADILSTDLVDIVMPGVGNLNVSKDKQIEMINQALVSMDMMASVVARIEEILN